METYLTKHVCNNTNPMPLSLSFDLILFSLYSFVFVFTYASMSNFFSSFGLNGEYWNVMFFIYTCSAFWKKKMKKTLEHCKVKTSSNMRKFACNRIMCGIQLQFAWIIWTKMSYCHDHRSSFVFPFPSQPCMSLSVWLCVCMCVHVDFGRGDLSPVFWILVAYQWDTSSHQLIILAV